MRIAVCVATLLAGCAAAPAPLATPASAGARDEGAPCSTESKEAVWACIHDSFRRAQARACYESARAAEPALDGHLIVAWTIDDRGEVTQVRFDEDNSQVKSEAVRACVRPIFFRTRWNPGAAGHLRTAIYDFHFKP